jgi:hypothetical protein
VYFDLVAVAGENRGTATRAKVPPGVVARFAVDSHRFLRKDRRREK